MILEKGRQFYITKQLMDSFSVNIRISQPTKVIRLDGHHFLGLTNPDVNLKRLHQLYNVVRVCMSQCCTYDTILHAWHSAVRMMT